MTGCGGNCRCAAMRACDETKEKIGMTKVEGDTCPCGKPTDECCKTTGKTCDTEECHGCSPGGGGQGHTH